MWDVSIGSSADAPAYKVINFCDLETKDSLLPEDRRIYISATATLLLPICCLRYLARIVAADKR